MAFMSVAQAAALGTAQAATGDGVGARATLKRAAQGRNPAVRAEALELLEKLR